ncbi:MAG: aspartate kinase [Chitinophagaceae bacterium]|jgi:aspartate kinase|nr:aspartate kinase [Chitinophagaceae bacterium]MBK7678988.1 aspartate kinase [Chitinophagaceae bacterium]MBK8299668.1 aspartate kinase [Chitinophagaceae bacterium]MBK9659164.1 aspartate kinase [Chitinophagaceae bacterium]MBK9937312.1 aspartate kinase [Chitinophagaceae bacterium]
MKVMKFGGTSVGKPERMHQIVTLVTKETEPVIVVLSALSGTTNALVEIGNHIANGDRNTAKQCIDKLEAHYQSFITDLVKKPATIAKAKAIVAEHFEFLNIILKISYSEALSKDILAQGELLSTKLFCVYLEEQGINHLLLPALEFMTIDNYDEPQVGSIKVKLTQLLKQHNDKKFFVTQGYICRNARGEVDNLKRGGSDYSASLIAAAINATVCEIWTDIDGMHNNDPRVVKKTVPVEQMSFDEAAELAYFGAKILHPASIWPAQQYNIPVKLLNTMQPDARGTLITEKAGSVGVKAVAAKDNIIAIRIKSSRMLLAYGFLRKIFEVFEKYRTPIDMITTSEVAVSLTIDNPTHLKEILKELEPFGTVEVDENQVIISVVGNEISRTEDMVKKLFGSIMNIPVRMVSYGGSPHNISLLLPAQYKTQILQQLNKGMFGLE